MSGTIYTIDFADGACRDARQVGGKAAGLAEMTAAGLPVAPGFVVNAAAYREFLARDGLGEFASAVADELGQTHDRARFDAAARRLEERFATAALPADVAAEVRARYRKLGETLGVPDVAVAVRSSATAEDSVGASFAGEFETWVDVVGEDSVVEHVARCYRSVFSARVMSYLAEKHILPDVIEMAVVIQKTVRARAAGVMFTLSPTSGDRSKVAIEASWGLGLSVVGGEVTPDRFLVDKVGLAIVERTLGTKEIEYRRGDATVPVPEERRHVPCLSDVEITALAELGKRLEKMHGTAQDIEFALDEDLPAGDNAILLQCRPETVWSGVERKPAFDATAGMMSWITGSISGAPAGGSAVGHQHEARAS
ncbi:PEP/pyruvate-binding domain-containing protein [Georgenia sp. EYE_87]|uniref:PEP/pyruvate-binding domain-containing protein n=1 Tax=Georgenia sp. EYE_87 TaxID=2853448 RepID=UPI002004C336|nr:PEP/pyruvate-binding domain-containing protein [Georgenia sp. EYE_87]MCK6211435.1 PEP/pyruvate-binding domain-containing protein [Georgenia sp. EYE_87]